MSLYLQGQPLPESFGLESWDNVLFAHAHPDDETVLTGNAIHRLGRAGVNVYTYIASDGTNSTLGDPQFVQSGQRRWEATLALKDLGVPSENQHYAGLEDGRLAEVRQTMARHIGSIIHNHDISAVFTAGASGYDGHEDHFAVHQAVLEAAQADQIPVWGLSPEPADVRIAGDPVTKLNALRRHASQFPGRARKPYIMIDSSTMVTSERLLGIHGSIEPALSPYYALFYFGEHYERLEPQSKK